MALRVTTINVNGIRAAVRKGFLDWLDQHEPDLVTLQEVRAPEGMLADLVGEGWHVVDVPSDQPGRAGVAVMSRRPIPTWREGLDDPAARCAGRWLEVDLEVDDGRTLTIVSSYVHTGDAEKPERMAEKYAYLDAAIARLAALDAAGNHVAWTGDINVAHGEWDIKNWKGNRKKAGFLPEERAELDRIIDEHGFVDVVRTLAGDGPGPYSWWSYRGRAYDNDAGWRIDYHLTNPDLAATAKAFHIDRSMEYHERWSDHAPVTVTYDLTLEGA